MALSKNYKKRPKKIENTCKELKKYIRLKTLDTKRTYTDCVRRGIEIYLEGNGAFD